MSFCLDAAVAAFASGNPAREQAAGDVFTGGWQIAEVVHGAAEQAAVVAGFCGRPLQCRAGAGFLQKAQAGNRAGCECATHTAAVAGLPLGWFGRGGTVEVDDLIFHVAQ